MTVRMHMIEDATKHLGIDLVRVLINHIAVQRGGGLTSRECASSVLSAMGFAAASALKAVIVFSEPDGRSAMYDEAVEKLLSVVMNAKPEMLADIEELSR